MLNSKILHECRNIFLSLATCTSSLMSCELAIFYTLILTTLSNKWSNYLHIRGCHPKGQGGKYK